MGGEPGVFPPKPPALEELFGTSRVLIGVVHCLPLPGGPQYRGQSITEVVRHAVEEARAYATGGVHGVIVENAWDLPFAQPKDQGFETAAWMAVIADHVRESTDLTVGVNVLANGVQCSIAAAQAGQGRFVRANQWVNAYVANEGLLDGASPTATRYRSHLQAYDVRVFADVHVKHGSHAIVADRSIEEQTEDAEFFDADVLIATGSRTGDATPIGEIDAIKRASDLPVVIGSGIDVENADQLLSACEGAIVGSSLKDNRRWWGRVDSARVRELSKIAERLGYELT